MKEWLQFEGLTFRSDGADALTIFLALRATSRVVLRRERQSTG
jgi:hypothetical protein